MNIRARAFISTPSPSKVTLRAAHCDLALTLDGDTPECVDRNTQHVVPGYGDVTLEIGPAGMRVLTARIGQEDSDEATTAHPRADHPRAAGRPTGCWLRARRSRSRQGPGGLGSDLSPLAGPVLRAESRRRQTFHPTAAEAVVGRPPRWRTGCGSPRSTTATFILIGGTYAVGVRAAGEMWAGADEAATPLRPAHIDGWKWPSFTKPTPNEDFPPSVPLRRWW